MIRYFSIAAGFVFVAALFVAFVMPRDAAQPNIFHEFHKEPKEVSFAFDGPLDQDTGHHSEEQLAISQ